ncbi:EAL domain-containing protein [Pelagibacterium sp.]|uniref:bifunctional diguanylate cyclase/phosphodiesterase n=1 Tax=Pelagibacterium sp. TaxID=1967288 RepID=UPI003A8E817D
MGEVLSTLYNQHDIKLVILAALICALASFAGVSILTHARRSIGLMRSVWLAVAAVSVGFGIWATHFVAMLSFDVGFPASYDIGLTLASLLIAIAVCGMGLAAAGMGRRRSDLVLGGAIVGLGISAMHYTGMRALEIGGEVSWDSGLVAGSVISGMVLGAAALRVGVSRNAKARAFGTGLLTLAICSMHFTAMGAAGFVNCFAIAAAGEFSPALLSLFVGVASILIFLAALASLYLDLRDRKRAAAEESRMRGLADAAVEGLVVCSDRTVVAVNAAFQEMVGAKGRDLAGTSIGEFLAATGCVAIFEQADELVETELTDLKGEHIPVEVVMREVDFGGRLHRAIAVRDLRARKQAEHHIRFLAHHDAMTGLANRASFNDRLEDEIARARLAGQKLAVLCLDLDRFKEINDLFGHAAGDALLQRVARLIEDGLKGRQFAGRLGGDEFAVILPDVPSAQHASKLAEDMLELFSRANRENTDGTVISASVGIALYPDDAEDVDQLMTYADTALYCAKAEGRGTYRLFESQMGAQVRDRRLLEHDLRAALVSRELSLAYQPQVDLESGEVSGFEALVRWAHPQRGAVPPSTFIPIAEETGLILQLGEWVMRTACEQAASWTSPLMVAVNVSAVQLHAPNFVAFVEGILSETGLSADRLEIEITETAMIRNMNRALVNLRQIKALGVKVAMDDFGTGYSSLSNLRAFPFDRIKVDQSFIRAVHDNDQSAAIVRAVLGLGKGLNLPILAEGVERPEELEFLRGEVCNAAQGYWFSKPEDISAFEEIVRGTQRTISSDQNVVPLKRRA